MLDPSGVESTPWRNGAGATRELAIGTGSDGGTAWRISVATLDRAAPFSSFPGLDRLFVALGPLGLTIDGVTTPMAAGDQIRFAGEADVAVTLDAPTSAVNVMTRRGDLRADVVLRAADGPAVTDADASVLLGDAVADVSLIPLDKDPR